MNRNQGLDALRGLMLVLMTLTHIPTMAARWSSQPFGYVSDAEGFVFLSAYLVGRIYSRKVAEGISAVGAPVWRRTVKIYLYHLATLAFAFTFAAAVAEWGQRPRLINLLGYYLDQPWHALLDSVLLIYRPPLMDILPMYVGFMLVVPYLLITGSRRGWGGILAVSVLIWLGAQFGLRTFLHDGFNAISSWQLPPVRHLGAFNVYSWQLLWIGGLWLGQQHARDPQLIQRLPRFVVDGALGLVIVVLALRYAFGGYPAHAPAWLLTAISKWNLGALRMLNFTALTIVVIRYGHLLTRWLPTAALQLLGRASLPVFSAHVVACLTALSLFHSNTDKLSPVMQVIVIAATFALLFAVAVRDQRTRQPKARSQIEPRQA